MTTPPALVTGAPGWLGTRLVQALRDGLPESPELVPEPGRVIRCLVHADHDAADVATLGSDVEIVRGDLTRPESLRPLFLGAAGATVFHSAGIIHPSWSSEFDAVNVNGTASLLREAIRANVRRFVYVSSNSPIGTNPSSDRLFDESAPFHPYMGYGASKRRAEDLVGEADCTGEIETVIIRPPWFYGPGQPPRQSLFFRMIKDGRIPVVGGGENRRSMAFIDNICQGLLLCERIDRARGRTYWIADRQPYSMNEIIDTVERVMERDFGIEVAHARIRVPSIVSEVAYAADWAIQRVGLYNQKVHVLSEMNKTIACSIARAERELGYSPRVSLEEGMRRSIAWMKSCGIAPWA